MKKIIIKIIDYLNLLIPKCKRKMIFYSSFDFGDNARSIYEHAKRDNRFKEYRFIWLVSDPSKYKMLNEPCKFYKHFSIKGILAYITAKYIIRTHSLYGNLYNKKNQVMVLAFHGMPIKTLEKNNLRNNRNDCTFLLSTSTIFNNALSYMFSLEEKFINVIGLPRNDDLFESKNILKQMGLNNYEKKIIWMPTFRNSKYSNMHDGKQSEFGIPCVKKEDLKKLDLFLQSKNYILILKLHPWASDEVGDISSYSNIINIKNENIQYPFTLYNFLGEMDLLLTDFSSVYIDFLLTGKPIAFVYDDFAEYSKSRNFAFEPIEEFMVGEKINSFDKLLEYLNNIDLNDEKYKIKRKEITTKFHKYCDNNSSKRVLDCIFDYSNKSVS